MRGGPTRWPVAALAAALLAGCGQAPIPTPDPGRDSAPAALRSFRFPFALNPALPADCDAVIDGPTVNADVPFPENRGPLVAEFVAEAEQVLVEGQAQVSGVTANDFAAPVVYTLVGEDSEPREYTVRVTGRWADTFDRDDCAEVGGGWVELEPGTTDRAEASIVSCALVLRGSSESTQISAGVQRDFPDRFSGPFLVSARFRREVGAVLLVHAWDGSSGQDCWFTLEGNSLSLRRDGREVASRAVSYEYAHSHTLRASVGEDELSVCLVDDETGASSSLACAGPAAADGFTHIAIHGGRYIAGFDCLTIIDRVELTSCGQ